MTEIKISSKITNKKYIDEIIEKALKDFKIENKIKVLEINIKKELKNDINVDYSELKSGKVKIEFGRKNNITRKSIYHELGHVWDAIKNELDFSKIRLNKKQQLIGGIIVNLSLDGRLEKLGFPHYSKRQRVSDFGKISKKFNLEIKKDKLIKFWGIKLSRNKTLDLIKQLGS